jgi:hypothetical protein
MCPLRSDESTAIEYRQTGFTKAANLFFVGILFLFAVFVLFRFATSQDFTDGVAFAGLIIAGDVFYLATVLRSRILIEGTRVRVRNAFVERTADITEIEGVRDIPGKNNVGVVGKLLCLKDGRGTIRISLQTLDLDDRFTNWLKQFPNLDKSDK